MHAIGKMAMRVSALAALTVVWANDAVAQEWNWQIAPYLWTAGIDGDFALGPVESKIDVNFSDIVDVLEGAVLLYAEGGNDNHGVFGNIVWLSLELDDEVTSAGAAAELQFDTTIFELGYLRKLQGVGIEFGVRYWDFELEINPVPIPAIERAQDWTDGFVGIRRTSPLGDNWSWTGRLNVGAGGSDFTYGLSVDFARALNSGNQFILGFKALDIDYEEPSVGGIRFKVDATFLGAMIGYLFN